MAYSTNKFCWHGVISSDVAATEAFYPKVLGWSVQKMNTADFKATMFANQGKAFAHHAEPQRKGVPSHWNSYLRVEDVDASTKLAVKNGGAQVVEPTDIPPGRFSIVTSPSGAAFSLYRERGENSAPGPGGVGSIHWNELHSKDLDADLAWLKATFGFTWSEMAMPQGPYFILKNGDEPAGGAMTSVTPDAPSMWLTWVNVKDVDATLNDVKSNGGAVHGDIMDIPDVGRMAVVADPAGGVFGIITPSN